MRSALLPFGMGLLALYLASGHWQQATLAPAIGLTVVSLLCFVAAAGILFTTPGARPAPTLEPNDAGHDFVEILRSTDVARLHVLRGMLEVNGVEVRLQDTEASSVFGGIPGFSAKLLVVRSDAPRAKALIDRAGAS